MAKKAFNFDGIVKTAQIQKERSTEEIKKSIKVDPAFQSLIPPLSSEEFSQLEENIKAEGCRDPLILWEQDGAYMLVDGHNRFQICTKNQIDFKIIIKNFENEYEVKNWMILNQLGRRNLTQEQIAYFRGKRYENEKEQGKRSDLLIDNLTSGNNYHKIASLVESGVQEKQINTQRTAQKLAEQLHVSEKTIRLDAQFAKGVDLIGTVSPELKKDILAGQHSVNKKDIQKLSKLDGKPKEETVQAIQAVINKPQKKKTVTIAELQKEEKLIVENIKKDILSLLNQVIETKDRSILTKLKNRLKDLELKIID